MNRNTKLFGTITLKVENSPGKSIIFVQSTSTALTTCRGWCMLYFTVRAREHMETWVHRHLKYATQSRYMKNVELISG